MIIKCETCKKKFNRQPSLIKNHNFCCRECFLIFQRKDMLKYTCETCDKKFTSSNKENANRFCSKECYLKFHKIKDKERACPTCKKIFTAKTSEDKYCSRECYDNDRHMPSGEDHWNWQGGISKLNDRHDSHEYKKWRLEVYKKDNYCCVKCNSKKNINAHHIYSWKHHPELRYEIRNGITLCEECHITLHQKYGYDSDQEMI